MDKIDNFFGYYRFLSNFYEREIEYEGLIYESSEAAYQAAKIFGKTRKKFTELSPGQAKKLGQKVKLRPHWEEIKDRVMYEIVYIKFSQNEDLKEKLLLTGGKIIVEASPYDSLWGVAMGPWDDRILDPKNWKGVNWLGEAIMKVRENLRKNIGEE